MTITLMYTQMRMNCATKSTMIGLHRRGVTHRLITLVCRCDGYGNPEDGVLVCTRPEGCADNRDCDTQALVPRCPRICDLIDNDYDTVIDEDSSLDATIYYKDFDGDGYGNPFTDRRCFMMIIVKM